VPEYQFQLAFVKSISVIYLKFPLAQWEIKTEETSSSFFTVGWYLTVVRFLTANLLEFPLNFERSLVIIPSICDNERKFAVNFELNYKLHVKVR